MNYAKFSILPIIALLMLPIAGAYGDDEVNPQPVINAFQSLIELLNPAATTERDQKKAQQEAQNLQQYNQEQDARRAELQRQSELEQQQEIAKQKAKELEQRESERIRINELRAGKIPINNTNDAVDYYNAKSVHNIMISPLLTPDRKVYGGVVTIDQQQDTGALVVKIENGISLLGSYPVKFEIAYAELRLDSKTKNFGTMPLRVGGQIHFVGQYVSNEKYSTVIGSGHTMPVLRALYMDGSTQGFTMLMVRPE